MKKRNIFILVALIIIVFMGAAGFSIIKAPATQFYITVAAFKDIKEPLNIGKKYLVKTTLAQVAREKSEQRCRKAEKRIYDILNNLKSTVFIQKPAEENPQPKDFSALDSFLSDFLPDVYAYCAADKAKTEEFIAKASAAVGESSEKKWPLYESLQEAERVYFKNIRREQKKLNALLNVSKLNVTHYAVKFGFGMIPGSAEYRRITDEFIEKNRNIVRGAVKASREELLNYFDRNIPLDEKKFDGISDKFKNDLEIILKEYSAELEKIEASEPAAKPI